MKINANGIETYCEIHRKQGALGDFLRSAC